MEDVEYIVKFKSKEGKSLRLFVIFESTTHKADRVELDAFINNLQLAAYSKSCSTTILTCLLQEYRLKPDIGYKIKKIKIMK